MTDDTESADRSSWVVTYPDDYDVDAAKRDEPADRQDSGGSGNADEGTFYMLPDVDEPAASADPTDSADSTGSPQAGPPQAVSPEAKSTPPAPTGPASSPQASSPHADSTGSVSSAQADSTGSASSPQAGSPQAGLAQGPLTIVGTECTWGEDGPVVRQVEWTVEYGQDPEAAAPAG